MAGQNVCSDNAGDLTVKKHELYSCGPASSKCGGRFRGVPRIPAGDEVALSPVSLGACFVRMVFRLFGSSMPA
jgi:hypothetical protein